MRIGICEDYNAERCLKKALYLGRELYPVSLDSMTSLCCKDILYLHAEQKYTIFYTLEGTTFSNRKSLNVWEDELLRLGFCRIHRSYLINLKYATLVNKKTATLSTGEVLPVSRRHSHHAVSSYKSYILNSMAFDSP